jgi:hypothetical protein
MFWVLMLFHFFEIAGKAVISLVGIDKVISRCTGSKEETYEEIRKSYKEDEQNGGKDY